MYLPVLCAYFFGLSYVLGLEFTFYTTPLSAVLYGKRNHITIFVMLLPLHQIKMKKKQSCSFHFLCSLLIANIILFVEWIFCFQVSLSRTFKVGCRVTCYGTETLSCWEKNRFKEL